MEAIINILRKENEQLKKDLQYYKDRLEEVLKPQVVEVSKLRYSFLYKRKFFNKIDNLEIKVYDDFIQIGALLFYDLQTGEVKNASGENAKQYFSKSGIPMYYYASGFAISLFEMEKIVSEIEI